MLTHVATAFLALVALVGIPAMEALTASRMPTEESLGVECTDMSGVCFIHVERAARDDSLAKEGSASPNDTHSDGQSTPACTDSIRHVEVPCYDPERGWWDATIDCYHMLADPQPPIGDAIWRGHVDGAIYIEVCPYVQGSAGLAWMASPPPGFGVATTPAQLAERAIEMLALSGPEIHMAPDPDGPGLVGVPVWMWTQVSARTWGPVSRTASIPGLAVTATARADRIVWTMGDGTTVTCRGPGTPYRARYGSRPSPDCGHTYVEPSAGEPGHVYHVSASTRWRVAWSGGGASGSQILTRTSRTSVEVGELQVLVS